MADWTAQVFQNEYLPDGATDVHAIVTVTSQGTGQAGEKRGQREHAGVKPADIGTEGTEHLSVKCRGTHHPTDIGAGQH